MVEQDADDLIRFDYTSNPSSVRIFAAAFNNGFIRDSIRVKVDSAATGAENTAPLYLRVKREGNIWTLWYSVNGTTWIVGTKFHHALTVTKVGVFAGNAGRCPPAHTGKVDYFRTDGVTVNLKAYLQGPYIAAFDYNGDIAGRQYSAGATLQRFTLELHRHRKRGGHSGRRGRLGAGNAAVRHGGGHGC